MPETRPVYGTLYVRSDQVTPRVNHMNDGTGRVIVSFGEPGGVDFTIVGTPVSVCDLLTGTCRQVAASQPADIPVHDGPDAAKRCTWEYDQEDSAYAPPSDEVAP